MLLTDEHQHLVRLLPAGVQQQLPVGGSDALEESPHPETGSGPHEGAADRRCPGRRSHSSGRPRHHGAAGRTAVHLTSDIYTDTTVPLFGVSKSRFWKEINSYILEGCIYSVTKDFYFK